jgi:hypothetical protein
MSHKIVTIRKLTPNIFLFFILFLAPTFSLGGVVVLTCPNQAAIVPLPIIYHGGFSSPFIGSIKEPMTPIDFSKYRSFFGMQFFDCSAVSGPFPAPVTVQGKSYVSFFDKEAFFDGSPVGLDLHNFLSETIPVIASAALAFMSIVFLVRRQKLLAIVALAFVVYAGLSVAGVLGISISMFLGHKMADFSLWAGVVLMHSTNSKQSRLKLLSLCLALLAASILAAPNGAIIQLLAYAAFLPAILLILEFGVRNNWSKHWLFATLLVMTPDLFFITLYPHGPMILPVGLVMLLLPSIWTKALIIRKPV